MYTIEDAKIVARILKLAQRAARAAMYNSTGGNHTTETRIALNSLTTSNHDTVAKAIIDIVKTDDGE
jgi:hypothetical protein